ncbi:zinc finger protein 45-like isoform X2 [Diabrotica virgifera virgifera]|uniref:C2H2-type domain-containing protein n=1 Tax=Diabrotica virgifera virgifera TaxID=50390 RepID=A0ABM5L5K3_DIAVI|nr:zinc finger protein 45-like isoform X2 [Diabrotica virgifera virgifera]
MERKEKIEDTVTNIKDENTIFVKPEFIKVEPAPGYLDPYIEDQWQGDSDISLNQIKTELLMEDMTFEQHQGDLAQFQYCNSDVDNIKLEHTAKGSQSSEYDSFTNEIKEDFNRESICDAFDDSGLNEYSLKIEIEDEKKLMPYGEKQTHKEGYLQDGNKVPVMEKLIEDSSYKGNDTSGETESKTSRKNMIAMTGKRPYKCEICFKKCTTASNLKVHLRVHTGETPHQCEFCFKQCSTASNLKEHMRVHTGEKPYKCKICLKQFSQASPFKTHLRVHTGEKPYKCEICFTQFSVEGSLKRHLRTHTGEKPYKCEICLKQFSQAGTLKTHLRVHNE